MIAPQSLHWIFLPFLLAVLMLVFTVFWIFFVLLSLFFLGVASLFVFFFRDPEISLGSGVISPADGTLVSCGPYDDPEIGACTKISIFMNIWNIHVNRAPLDGTLVTLHHHQGKHGPAFKKDISDNESVSLIFHTRYGDIKVIQITGVFARRIVNYVSPGDTLSKGDRIGIVRFGSRVEVYLPKTIDIVVSVGQRISVGDTLGMLPSPIP